MKKRLILTSMVLALCLICAGAASIPDMVFAKGITTASQAKKLAKKQVKGASSVKVKTEREHGALVYQVKLVKGKKEYELAYRASDGKLVSQSWELRKAYVKKGSGKLIGIKKCKIMAKKQVSNGKIVSAAKKRSRGIDLYDIKMQKSSKKYELKYHARTGKLLEYEWELTTKNTQKKEYISESQAKKAALEAAGGGKVVKVKFTTDDGVKVYEIDVVNGNFEYEITIHAETGKVLDVDKERIDTDKPGENTNSGTTSDPEQDTIISQEEAEAIALEAAGGGSVVKAKLDTDDGVKVYEVDIVNGEFEYDIEILASTGEVLKVDKEPIQTVNPGQDPNPGQDSIITQEEAKAIALEAAGGGNVVKIKLDTDDGLKVYDVDVINGEFEYDIEILASTGEVLKVDKEPIQTVNPGQDPNPGQPQPGESQQVSLDKAKEIAVSDAGLAFTDATFTKAKLDYEDGILVYEIEFCTDSYEYEYEIDAATGEIYKKEQKKLKNTSGENSGNTDSYIGLEQAKQIAAGHAGFSASEVRFKEAKLDREDGRMVYEVEFIKGGMEYEYEINALTGRILDFEQEWDD